MKVWQNLCALSFLVFIIPVFNQACAQNKYFSLGIGYNVRSSSFYRGEELNYNSTGSTSYGSKMALNVSFGQGFNIGAAFGYLFTKNMAAEIGIDYLEGNRILTDKSINSYVSGVDKSTFEIQLRSLRIIPSIKICTDLGKWSPYTQFGIIIGVLNNVQEYSFKESSVGSSTTTTLTELNLKGRISFGFSAGAGITYQVRNRLKVFAECRLISQSFTPEKEKMTKYEIDGVDKLASLNIIDKEVLFEDNYIFNNGIIPDNNSPRKTLAVSAPNSTVGFNLGIQIVL